MGNNIHHLIRSEYEKKQKAAFDSLISRRDEIYKKIPRIEEIDNQIHIIGVRCNKSILLGSSSPNTALSELSEKLELLKSEKKQLILKYGYPEQYMEITYQCSKCNDTGFINSTSEKCTCYKQALIKHTFSVSNIKLARTENFSSFNESYYPDVSNENRYGTRLNPRENILQIKERCLQFIKDFQSPEEKNLFFSGPTGVGKTFMSNCIALEILNRGNTVLYQTAPVLFNTISQYKQKAFKDDANEDEIYNSIFEVDLLIIDDLGTEPQSSARFAELLNILNTRHINNLSKPCKTIISTNIGAKKLQEYYTERVTSRIMGCFERLMFVGEDIRSIKSFQSK